MGISVVGQIEEELKEIESIDEIKNMDQLDLTESQRISVQGPISSLICC